MIDTTIVFLICVGVAFLSALCLSVPYLIREQERDEDWLGEEP